MAEIIPLHKVQLEIVDPDGGAAKMLGIAISGVVERFALELERRLKEAGAGAGAGGSARVEITVVTSPLFQDLLTKHSDCLFDLNVVATRLPPSVELPS